jgi:hypothetical protein
MLSSPLLEFDLDVGSIAQGAPNEIELVQQHRRAGDLTDMCVELTVEGETLGPVLAPDETTIHFSQLLKVGSSDALGCELGPTALQHAPEDGGLIYVSFLGPKDDGAAMGFVRNVALRLQSTERLSHGGRADTEQLGEIALAELGPRRELPILDHQPDGVGDEIRLAAVVDFGGHGPVLLRRPAAEVTLRFTLPDSP